MSHGQPLTKAQEAAFLEAHEKAAALTVEERMVRYFKVKEEMDRLEKELEEDKVQLKYSFDCYVMGLAVNEKREKLYDIGDEVKVGKMQYVDKKGGEALSLTLMQELEPELYKHIVETYTVPTPGSSYILISKVNKPAPKKHKLSVV